MINKFIIGLAVLIFIVQPAQARKTGDMFNDSGWNFHDRPSGPSDARRGQDMIPSVPVNTEGNPDMFGRVRPPYDFGREDMFVTHPQPVPYYSIFKDEHDTK